MGEAGAFLASLGVSFSESDIAFYGFGQIALYSVLLVWLWFAPNIVDMFQHQRPALLPDWYTAVDTKIMWSKSIVWGAWPG